MIGVKCLPVRPPPRVFMNVGRAVDAIIAPHVRRSKVSGVKMSSTSSRFPTPTVACKFHDITMKEFCDVHHQDKGVRTHTV